MRAALLLVYAAAAVSLDAGGNPFDRMITAFDQLHKESVADLRALEAREDKFGCFYSNWTKKNEAAMKNATELIAEMEEEEKKKTVSNAKGDAELKNSQKELAEAEQKLQESTDTWSAKKSELTERINQDEADHAKVVDALKALTTMRDKVEGVADADVKAARSFVQQGGEGMPVAVRVALELVNPLHLTHKQEDALEQFKSARTGFMQSATGRGMQVNEYQVGSKVIIGIFTTMKNDLAADKAAAEAERAAGQKAFDNLSASLNDSIKNSKREVQAFQESSSSDADDAAHAQRVIKEQKTFLEDRLQAKEKLRKESVERARLFSDSLALGKAEGSAIEEAIKIMKKVKTAHADAGYQAGSASFIQRASSAGILANLRRLARSTGSLRLAEIAVMIQTQSAKLAFQGETQDWLKSHQNWRWYVQKEIDEMVEALRQEQSLDQQKRDACEEDASSTDASIADEKNHAAKEGNSQTTLEQKIKAAEDLQKAMRSQIKSLVSEYDTMSDERSQENEAFRSRRAADVAAFKGMQEAVAVLEAFVSKAGSGVGLFQRADPKEKYNADKDKSYTKRASFRTQKGFSGVIQLAGEILNGFGDEMELRESAEAKALKQYQDDRAANLAEQKESEKTIAEQEVVVAALQRDLTATKARLSAANSRKGAQEDAQKSIKKDCAWVTTHFASRLEKRDKEIAGLIDARGFLQNMQ